MALLARYSGAMVSVLELDLMDPLSVVNASKDFKKRLACFFVILSTSNTSLQI